MKQILTYISPDKEFNEEHKKMVKIQIDNSLRLEWKRKDIMLVTNFKYEYNGVKSIVIPDDNYCPYLYFVTKIYVINYLFKNGLIKNGLYWYHDFDSFEFNKIDKNEVLDEMGVCDLGVSNYGQKIRLCSASMFFHKSAVDIFDWLRLECDEHKINEEVALMRIYYNKDNHLSKRIKMVNTSYAFHKFNIVKTYKTSLKPIRVAHFHITPDKYDFYVRGNNKLNMPLVPKELINIFHKYGFKG